MLCFLFYYGRRVASTTWTHLGKMQTNTTRLNGSEPYQVAYSLATAPAGNSLPLAGSCRCCLCRSATIARSNAVVRDLTRPGAPAPRRRAWPSRKTLTRQPTRSHMFAGAGASHASYYVTMSLSNTTHRMHPRCTPFRPEFTCTCTLTPSGAFWASGASDLHLRPIFHSRLIAIILLSYFLIKCTTHQTHQTHKERSPIRAYMFELESIYEPPSTSQTASAVWCVVWCVGASGRVPGPVMMSHKPGVSFSMYGASAVRQVCHPV
jgi:hypothetical protein